LKKIFLIRHAKSSWNYPDLADFERPLNKRGRTVAPFMAQKLAEKKYQPDLIISSPAIRAAQTARIFADILKYDLLKIDYQAGIYDGDDSDYFKIINDLKDRYKNIFIFGHNPDIHIVAQNFLDKYLDHFPTCCICGIQFEVKSWKNVHKRSGEQFLFNYPKKYQS